MDCGKEQRSEIMTMELLTHNNAPFGSVGLDSNHNPPGYAEYHKTHDYIPPCDQYGGGTWLKPGTYTYKLEEYKKSVKKSNKKRIQLSKWVVSKQEDGEITYAKKDPSGRTVITVHQQDDEWAGGISIAIRYYTKTNGKWGEFVADAITDKDIADRVVRAWLEKKGYDYE